MILKFTTNSFTRIQKDLSEFKTNSLHFYIEAIGTNPINEDRKIDTEYWKAVLDTISELCNMLLEIYTDQ